MKILALGALFAALLGGSVLAQVPTGPASSGGGGGGGCSSNCTLTGNTTTTAQTISGNISNPAAPATAGAGWWYNTNSILGTMTGVNQFSAIYNGINYSLNTNSNNGANVNSFEYDNVNLQNGYTGNFNLMFRFLNGVGTPGAGDTSAHAYVVDLNNAQASNNAGGTGDVTADALGSYWSGNDNTYTTAAATFLADLWGREIDCGMTAGSSAVREICAGSILDALSAASPSTSFIGYTMAAKPGASAFFHVGFGFGSEAGTWPFDANSCLYCATQRSIPTLSAQPTADRGIDFRVVNFGTGPVLVNKAGIDNNGVVNGANLQTGLGLTAQSGPVSAITAAANLGITGGAYFNSATLPTCAVAPPPNGGVTASCTITHMQLTKVVLKTAGTGYAVNDVITPSAGTGTAPTITVNTVGGGGQILTYTITTQGDFTVTPAASAFTGGTGTAATFGFGYGVKTATTASGTLYPAFPAPNVTVTAGTSSSEQIPAVLVATVTPAVVPLNFNSPLKMNIASTYSAANAGTTGLAMQGSTTTYNDSSSSGTIAVEAMYNPFGTPTITSTASTTYTDLVTLFVPLTTASTNVTASARYAIEAAGGIKSSAGQGIVSTVGMTINGGTVLINQNSNFATSINTGTSTQAINIGNSGTTGVTSLLGIATGTNADFLCLSAAGVVLLQTSACTISSERFKQEIMEFKDIDALAKIMELNPVTFRLKPTGNRDPNANSLQVGLIAEQIAKTDPQCAIYENDMKTPKSYRQECIIAQLVGAVKAQQLEIDQLKHALIHKRTSHIHR